MGCYKDAGICQLVGSFILNEVASINSKSNIWLYCDDSLEIFQDISKPKIKRMKKTTVKAFKGCDLSITMQCNLQTADIWLSQNWV